VSIEFIGYASPEGRFATNEYLAYDRAQGLARYLQAIYDIPATVLKIRTVGEDWNDLRKMVATSNIQQKTAILEIMDGNEHPDAKESKLRRAMGGSLWNTMIRDMFPELRRVEYKINYETVE
jgi:hypothetical protein